MVVNEIISDSKKVYHRIKDGISAWYISKRADKSRDFFYDEQSGILLDAREKWISSRRQDIFVSSRVCGGGQNPYFTIPELDGVLKAVIVYQDDEKLLSYYKKLLKRSPWKGRFRCVKIELLKYLNENETAIPCASSESAAASLANTIKMKIPGCKVLVPQYGYLVGQHGWQYFDVFRPVKDEIVVDAGSYDGQTEGEIIRWGEDNIKKIYAFEPDPDNIRKCKEYFRRNELECVEFIEKGTWNASTSMKMQGCGTPGSRVGTSGNISISLTSIDETVRDDKVTFIKMDVEGAELKSLQGARNTIKRNKPRLAICIYHKGRDLYEIPEYILSIVPEYRFYIRHYSSNDWETVLYASVP